jgi:hypothetical protein
LANDKLKNLQDAVEKFRNWSDVEYDPKAWEFLDKALEDSKAVDINDCVICKQPIENRFSEAVFGSVDSMHVKCAGELNGRDIHKN